MGQPYANIHAGEHRALFPSSVTKTNADQFSILEIGKLGVNEDQQGRLPIRFKYF